jgi:hypothetical protein
LKPCEEEEKDRKDKKDRKDRGGMSRKPYRQARTGLKPYTQRDNEERKSDE